MIESLHVQDALRLQRATTDVLRVLADLGLVSPEGRLINIPPISDPLPVRVSPQTLIELYAKGRDKNPYLLSEADRALALTTVGLSLESARNLISDPANVFNLRRSFIAKHAESLGKATPGELNSKELDAAIYLAKQNHPDPKPPISSSNAPPRGTANPFAEAVGVDPAQKDAQPADPVASQDDVNRIVQAAERAATEGAHAQIMGIVRGAEGLVQSLFAIKSVTPL